MKPRTRIWKILTVAGLASAVLMSTTACSTVAASDKIGLYYHQGPEDGDKFSFCIEPGQTNSYEWNNKVYFLPASLRTWNIGGPGSDSDTPIVSSSLPQDNQPSGVEVQVWPKFSFYLNTFCDEDGGMIRPFYEKICKRYSCDTDAGWIKMLEDVLVSALDTATRDVTRLYKADDMVGNVNGVRIEIQQKIAAVFTTELKRMAGGDYFCGPGFNRVSPNCPPIEVMVKDVSYNDPQIQAARNEKQKNAELAAAQLIKAQGEAAALLAEAEGKANAAAEIAALYQNPAWVRLQEMIIQAEMVKACGANPNCHMIVGADGNVIIGPR